MNTSISNQILRRARSRGLFRARDMEGLVSNPRVYIGRLVERGDLVRVGRGVYAVPDHAVTEHHSLVEAAQRCPSGVVCLLSALGFHGFTTQLPHEIWMAFRSNFTPSADGMPIRRVRMSGESFSHGVEEHTWEGTRIRVYSPAKTVADCFRFRNTVGLDVALEALKEGWRERRFTMDELWSAARACRIGTVMRPYMEGVVA